MLTTVRRIVLLGVLTALAAGCAPAAPAPSSRQQGDGATTQREPGRRKVLNMALNTIIDAFSIAGSSTTSGGGLGYIEIHSQALFTADKTTGRPIPRLLAEQPTLDNSGLKIGDDGRMTSTYRVRPDARWADGAIFTSRDLLFTFRVTKDKSIPIIDSGPSLLMESASAPDDGTFVVTWRQPYYLADAIGLRAFWPLPAHLIEADYVSLVEDQKDVASFLARPYWTSEYVHVGPFRLTEFVPQVQAVFDAVDTYFLGRPKVDRIVVRQFTDDTTVLANALAGGVDLASDGALDVERAIELKARWEAEGGGKVYFGTGTTQFVSIQFDANVPGHQAALLDRRVRQGLYLATDRDTYADFVSGGIPDRAAHTILPPDNPLFRHVKDGWRLRYPYDLSRAATTLEEAGWRRGSDGLLANAAGERLRVETRATGDNERRASVIADMWKRAGVEPDILVVPVARVRDREYRQLFPGGEITARGSQDAILTRLECAEQPTAQNRFSGNNRGHWCNQDYDRLVGQYRVSLREESQGQIMKSIQDLVLDELPILLLNYQLSVVFARKGVMAFQDDFAGGSEAGRIYGTYSRNAHEWDIL